MKLNTTRFSDRVDDYMKYRPSYPQEIIQILTDKVDLNKNSTIADIGSGTGISSQPFIDNGNSVFAVEPNKEMREAAELILMKEKKFISINGTAEKSGLKNNSIDIIFSGTAFHWFNRSETKIEFNRILKPGGHIVLAWNLRKENDGFQKEYETVLQTISEYKSVTHKNIGDKEIADFFYPGLLHVESLPNSQTFNLEGLKGRLQSSSYCPKEGEEHDKIMDEINTLFYKSERNGLITFDYETKIYWC